MMMKRFRDKLRGAYTAHQIVEIRRAFLEAMAEELQAKGTVLLTNIGRITIRTTTVRFKGKRYVARKAFFSLSERLKGRREDSGMVRLKGKELRKKLT